MGPSNSVSSTNTADPEGGATNIATGNSGGSVTAEAVSSITATGADPSRSGGTSVASASGGFNTGFVNGMSSAAFPAFEMGFTPPKTKGSKSGDSSPGMAITLNEEGTAFGTQGAGGFGLTNAFSTMGGFQSDGVSSATSSVMVDAGSDQTSISDVGPTQSGGSDIFIEGDSEGLVDTIGSTGGGSAEGTTTISGSTEGFSAASFFDNSTTIVPIFP